MGEAILFFGLIGGGAEMDKVLRIASYNLHKGLSVFNRRLVLHEIRQALRALAPDIVFLQEVQGEHRQHLSRFQEWPRRPQHEFLAWGELAAIYGRNASYKAGHHGNALLSRFPVQSWENHDLTLHRLEQRGLLQCELRIPGWDRPLHAFCVHLNLLARDRRRQLELLIDIIRAIDPADPVILAGDFNDWRQELSLRLHEQLGLDEAFDLLHGRHAISFPVRMPLLALDRIYVRGFRVEQAAVLVGAPWIGLSDHAPLCALLRRQVVA